MWSNMAVAVGKAIRFTGQALDKAGRVLEVNPFVEHRKYLS